MQTQKHSFYPFHQTRYTRKFRPDFVTKTPDPTDKPALWRRAADQIHLSDPARLRLEWMIFYHTVGAGKAYVTAHHFGTSPKNFYKWLARFEKQGVRGLEEQSRAPVHTRQWEVTRAEEERVVELRRQYLHYGKQKLKVIYAELYPSENAFRILSV